MLPPPKNLAATTPPLDPTQVLSALAAFVCQAIAFPSILQFWVFLGEEVRGAGGEGRSKLPTAESVTVLSKYSGMRFSRRFVSQFESIYIIPHRSCMVQKCESIS